MKRKKSRKLLSFIAIILGGTLFVWLMWTLDPLYGWKLNRASEHYGIVLSSRDVKWEYYGAKRRRKVVNDEIGRWLFLLEDRSPKGFGIRHDSAMLRVEYGWKCDSIRCPVMLGATYWFENKLFSLEFCEASFTKSQVYAELSEDGATPVDYWAYYVDELTPSQFLELRSSWERGERIWEPLDEERLNQIPLE